MDWKNRTTLHPRTMRGLSRIATVRGLASMDSPPHCDVRVQQGGGACSTAADGCTGAAAEPRVQGHRIVGSVTGSATGEEVHPVRPRPERHPLARVGGVVRVAFRADDDGLVVVDLHDDLDREAFGAVTQAADPADET